MFSGRIDISIESISGISRYWYHAIHIYTLTELYSCQILPPLITTNILEVTWNPQYARSKYPAQLAKINFDEILDLTADIFSFYNIGQKSKKRQGKSKIKKWSKNNNAFRYQAESWEDKVGVWWWYGQSIDVSSWWATEGRQNRPDGRQGNKRAETRSRNES